MLATAALAWVVIASLSVGRPRGTAGMHDSMGMAMSAPAARRPMSDTAAQLPLGSPALFGMWLLMVTAMMAPLVVGPLRHLGARSLPRRRTAARIMFLAAYAAVWSIGGVLLSAVAKVLGGTGSGAEIALCVAALWQFSPGKQWCLNRHHARPPLAAFGRRAGLAALHFGAEQGLWCAGSCWALMLLPLVITTHQPVAMIAVTLWIWAEQLEFPAPAAWRLRLPTRALLIARGSTATLCRPLWSVGDHDC